MTIDSKRRTATTAQFKTSFPVGIYADLAESTDITVVPIGGFSQRQRIQHAEWTFQKVLKADIAISALLDRDYRCSEEIEELVKETRATVPNFHILSGKEIENYLLIPAAIMRAVNDRLHERKSKIPPVSVELVQILLTQLSDDMKSAVLGQHISNRMRYFHNRTSKDPATVAQEAISRLDAEWESLSCRLMAVPGKQLLADVNNALQRNYGVSITASQIVRHLRTEEVAADLMTVLQHLNNFAKKQQVQILGESAA